MNVHILICVAYISRLCSCTGGVSVERPQQTIPGNRGAGHLPVNNQRVQGGPIKPPAVNQPNKVGNQPATGAGAIPPRGSPGVPNAGSNKPPASTPPGKLTRSSSNASLGSTSSSPGRLSRAGLNTSLGSTSSLTDQPPKVGGQQTGVTGTSGSKVTPGRPPAPVQPTQPAGTGATGTPPPRVGGQPVTQSGPPFGPHNVGSSAVVPQPTQQHTRPSSEVTRELIQHNATTLNLQHDLEAFINKDISANTPKPVIPTPPTKPAVSPQSVAPPKNNAPYEEKAQEEEEVIQEVDLPNDDEVVIQEEDLQEEPIQEGQSSKVEAARIGQELAQHNAATLTLQNNLESFMGKDLSPSKPLRDVEVHEEPSEVTKELAQRNTATSELQSNLEAFVKKDISVTSQSNGKVLKDTEVIEEPPSKGTNLNGQGTDSAWNLTDTSTIGTDIKKVKTAPPKTQNTAVRHGLGSGVATHNAGVQAKITATSALGSMRTRLGS